MPADGAGGAGGAGPGGDTDVVDPVGGRGSGHGRRAAYASDGRPHVVVLGAGRVGLLVTRAVRTRGFRCVVVDRDRRRLEQAARRGARCCLRRRGKPHDPGPGGLAEARLLVVAVADPLAARLAGERALAINPRLAIAARVRGARDRATLRRVGVRRVADPEVEAGVRARPPRPAADGRLGTRAGGDHIWAAALPVRTGSGPGPQLARRAGLSLLRQVTAVEPLRHREFRGLTPMGPMIGRDWFEAIPEGTRLTVQIEYTPPWGPSADCSIRSCERCSGERSPAMDGPLRPCSPMRIGGRHERHRPAVCAWMA